jgi:hypothetical protein
MGQQRKNGFLERTILNIPNYFQITGGCYWENLPLNVEDSIIDNFGQSKKPIKSHQKQKFIIFQVYKSFNNVMTLRENSVLFGHSHFHLRGAYVPFGF